MAVTQGILQGTLDLLILRSLRSGPLHGWGISRRIRDTSRGALEVNQGSLYPAPDGGGGPMVDEMVDRILEAMHREVEGSGGAGEWGGYPGAGV